MKLLALVVITVCAAILVAVGAEGTPSYGLVVWNVSIAGQGTHAVVNPGQSFGVTFNYWIWDRAQGQTNIMWIPMGVEQPSSPYFDAQDAYGPLLPGSYPPGDSGTASGTLTAPSTPGSYAVDIAVAATVYGWQAQENFEAVYDGYWLDIGVVEAGTGVEEGQPGRLPLETFLSSAHPNPFNDATTISYHLANRSDVSLNVYDVAGKIVRSLVNRSQDSGRYSVTWNGRDDSGQELPSGTYFYTLKLDGQLTARKAVHLK